MTTPYAEKLYLAQHLAKWEGQLLEVFNPHNKPMEQLPVIMGFNDGGSPGFYSAVAIAEDGHYLGGHCCSHEAYMPHDLGCIKGSRPDRHTEQYQKYYPDGYRMEFIPSSERDKHEKLNLACKLNQMLPEKKEIEQ